MERKTKFCGDSSYKLLILRSILDASQVNYCEIAVNGLR